MSTKEWNRKLAFRCRRIKDIYTRQSTNVKGKFVSAADVTRSVYRLYVRPLSNPFGEMTSLYSVKDILFTKSHQLSSCGSDQFDHNTLWRPRKTHCDVLMKCDLCLLVYTRFCWFNG